MHQDSNGCNTRTMESTLNYWKKTKKKKQNSTTPELSLL